MKRQISYYFCCIWLFCCVDSVFALSHRGPSYGDVFDNILGPLTGVISIVRAICIIAGIGMVLSSIVKFNDHRKNRHEVTLALVLTMFVAGSCLIGLSFIPFRGM